MPSRPVAAIFPGRIDDRSFMQAGHDGMAEACRAAGLPFTVTQAVPLAALPPALAEAAGGAGLVLAQGGQCEAAARAVAARFPATRFVVVQGHGAGGNLYAYRAAQEQSAFLAGAAAGLLTGRAVIGHVSGIRPRPGLLARAAFASGIAHVAPGKRLVSIFTGDQDDAALGRAAAKRLLAAGADIIFTMLNAAQDAVVAEARAGGAMLVGDGRDWVAERPAAFLLAAVADSGAAAGAAIADYAAGSRQAGAEVVFGLERPDIVRLACGASVPAPVRARLDAIAAALASGAITVPEAAAVEELA